jgi:uncharacterized protein (TIGR02453 family)
MTREVMVKASTHASDRFEGFASLDFFRELAKRQSREWFTKHKAEYDEGFVKPMTALLSEAADNLQRAYPDCELAEPKVFRIYRDVRFSRDKSPYKTHVAGVLAVRSGASKLTSTPAALYMHVGVDAQTGQEQRESGAGLYVMDSAQLARYRAAALDAKRGAELASILKKLEKAKMRFTAAESLKRPPAGVDPQHPRAEILKLKGLVAMFPSMPAALVKKRALLDWAVAQAKLAAPMVRWLAYEAR